MNPENANPRPSPVAFSAKPQGEPSQDGQAHSPQTVKRAQLSAVWRFEALSELLGERAFKPGKAIEFDPVLATPLPLLSGLGWDVGFSGGMADVNAAIAETYRTGGAQGYAAAKPDLLLSQDLPPVVPSEEELARLSDMLASDGMLVLTVRPGTSGMTMSQMARYVKVTSRRLKAAGFAAVEQHLFAKECWIAAYKVAPGSVRGRSIGRGELALWSGAGALRSMPERLLSGAWQTRSTRHGTRLAGHRLANARKAARLRRKAVIAKHSLVHFGVHAPDNAGDLVLFETVRQCIDDSPSSDWVLRDVRAPVTADTIEEINRSRGMVIGGGGLFLVDLDSSSKSGWQWPCPIESLREIEVPIIVFAVGYNRFRGQGEFPQAFVDSLKLLVEKAAFVGIRNHGSIAALRSYLPEELGAKLHFQPCPTTVLTELGAAPARRETGDGRKRLVINAAFDRFGNRLQGQYENALGGIASLAAHAKANGWEIIASCHSYDDEAIVPFLKRAGVEASVRHFASSPTSEILDFYAGVDLVAGMRGHAQMIPFGLGTPILSLIAHDKLGWFLDDIGHREWGVELTGDDAGERLRSAFDAIAGDLTATRAAIAAARQVLWDQTCLNRTIVQSALSLEG